MNMRFRTQKIHHIFLFSFISLVALMMFAACDSGSDTPAPPASANSDFVGTWNAGANTTLTITEDEDGIGFSYVIAGAIPKLEFGAINEVNGTATLMGMLAGSFTAPNTFSMFSESLTRVAGSASTGNITGSWINSDGDVTITLTGTDMAGAFTTTSPGGTLTGAYICASGVVILTYNFGTATLNAAKDTLSLTLDGETTPVAFTKATA